MPRRANSSFDMRQKLTGNWVFELPFGPNRALLSRGGFWSKALDGFSVSGDFTFAYGQLLHAELPADGAGDGDGIEQFAAAEPEFQRADRRRETTWQLVQSRPRLPLRPPDSLEQHRAIRLRGRGSKVVDVSLSRTVQLGDTRSFEARVTAANALNIVPYSGINTTLNSPTFGQVTGAAHDAGAYGVRAVPVLMSERCWVDIGELR